MTKHHLHHAQKTGCQTVSRHLPCQTSKKFQLLCEGINFDNEIHFEEDFQTTAKNSGENPRKSILCDKRLDEAVFTKNVQQSDENSNLNLIKNTKTQKSYKNIAKKVRFNLSDVGLNEQSVVVCTDVKDQHLDITKQIEEETRHFQTLLRLGSDLFDDDHDDDASFPLTQNIHRC